MAATAMTRFGPRNSDDDAAADCVAGFEENSDVAASVHVVNVPMC
jgi:hypothetical protein